MNIGMNVSFLFSVFVYFEYIPSSGIAGPYGSFIFIFLRKLHTVFHGDSTSLYSHQLCTRVSLSPHSHQCFLVVFFLMITILTDWRRQWHPTPVLLPGKSMDGGAWKAAVHGVAKSQTGLSDFTFTFHFHALEKEMATHSSVLAWRIPGTGEPGGLPSVGSHRVGHD